MNKKVLFSVLIAFCSSLSYGAEDQNSKVLDALFLANAVYKLKQKNPSKKIEILNFSDMEFTEINTTAINFNVLEITYLNLSKNPIQKIIAGSFNRCPSGTTINLIGHQLSAEEVKAIENNPDYKDLIFEFDETATIKPAKK